MFIQITEELIKESCKLCGYLTLSSQTLQNGHCQNPNHRGRLVIVCILNCMKQFSKYLTTTKSNLITEVQYFRNLWNVLKILDSQELIILHKQQHLPYI